MSGKVITEWIWWFKANQMWLIIVYLNVQVSKQECVIEKYFSYISTKHAMGTQENIINESILLSTRNMFI